jgi:hypothetical protein
VRNPKWAPGLSQLVLTRPDLDERWEAALKALTKHRYLKIKLRYWQLDDEMERVYEKGDLADERSAVGTYDSRHLTLITKENRDYWAKPLSKKVLAGIEEAVGRN